MSLSAGSGFDGSGLRAAADDDEHRDRDRYYDADARDYHQWNEREEWAWRHYLGERHREYREWAKANERERREYCKWRHKHMDWDDHR